MSCKKRYLIKRVFVLCLSLIALESFCFSYYWHNGSAGGYEEGTEHTVIQSNISIEILVTEGASYFLQVQAKVKTLLNLFELQDIKFIDYVEINLLVNNTLINIKNARLSFEELIKVAEVTPYNLDVIETLIKFDYENFLKVHSLNPSIFCNVREYLERGDITGTYKHSYRNFLEIEQLLLNIQSLILENRIPELEILWRLNELCAESSLFGSYIARIFKEMKYMNINN